MPNNLRWVWLDLDDTLIDFTKNAGEALEKLYCKYNLNRWFTTPEKWIEVYERHNTALWVDYSVGIIDSACLREQRFVRPLSEGGADNDYIASMWRELDKAYLDFLAEGEHTIAGAMSLLRQLHAMPDVKVGILSNGFSEVQYRKMDRVGISPYVDMTVLSDEVGVNKPHERIYTYAMERAGILDPCRHLMIGDNPATDIAGALRVGWGAIWLDNGKYDTPTPEGAMRIKTLAELANFTF